MSFFDRQVRRKKGRNMCLKQKNNEGKKREKV